MRGLIRTLLTVLIASVVTYGVAFAVDIKTTNGPGGWVRDGNIISVPNSNDVVVFPNFTGAGTLDAATLEGEAGSFYQDRTNHTGFQIASTISNFGDAVLLETLNSGIESHTPGDDTAIRVTFSSATSNLVDILAGDCHVQGTEYDFSAQIDVDPEFGVGENSRWFGCSSAGLIKQAGEFTDEQRRNTMPVARIQAKGNCTGPGCPISDVGILDHRYLIHEDSYRWERYLNAVMGAQIVDGGIVTENGTTPRNLDISSGELWDSDRMRQTWPSFTNLSGLYAFNNSSTLTVIPDITFNIDNVNWDNGDNLVPMTNNNYHCSNSLFMSARGTQDADFDRIRLILIHCTSEWPDLQGAIDSGIDFGPFISQQESGLVPLAQIIVKKNTANIVRILNVRGGVGQAVAGTTTTLQGAYNNSSPGSSEIVLNAAQDGFTISDNATPVGDLFKLNNFENTTSFFKVSPTDVKFGAYSGATGTDFLTIDGNGILSVAAVGGCTLNRNGTDQTGLTSGAYTKLSLTTEVYDTSGICDDTNSKIIPQAGVVHFFANARTKSATTVADKIHNLVLYKNGAAFKHGPYNHTSVSTTAAGVGLAADDIANGTDYYELYYYHDFGVAGSLEGDIRELYFDASQ